MSASSTASERVGRYQLLEPIGGGPNGTVARAKVFGVAGFERQFAVKRFLPELTVGASAQALSQAARAYGSLEHPRIARMSEFGVAQGQTFTAVEYVAGLDVFRLLQEAKLASVAIAAGGALALVSQAARAVGYAHGRGLSHLGLSPTNVIVTGDGDVKVTDFGILAATMPQRPAESTRMASRVPYLSPEQIAGEATSAATDVFVLGVIAYELVTGQRAYRGDTPAQIAQAILAGPPAEPPLPRPIVRVLQRCLARSPFERFPDARALADALDAALRVAPVPGTRKDVGAQVKTTLERYAALNEGNVSGMVALNLQTQAIADSPDVATQPFNPVGRPEARTEPSPMPVMPSPAATMRDIAKPFTTVPGLAPPPIPVPPGVMPPPGTANPIPGIPPAKTKLGIPPIAAPTRKPPPTPPAGIPKIPGPITAPLVPPPLPPADSMPSMEAVGAEPVVEIESEPPPRPGRSTLPGQNFDSLTGEMDASQLDALNRKAQMATSELMPMQRMSEPEISVERAEPDVVAEPANEPDPIAAFASDASEVAASLEPDPSGTMPSLAPPPPARSNPAITPPAASSPSIAPPPASPSPPSFPPAPASAQSNRLPLIAGIVLGVGLLGAAGFYGYRELIAKKDEPTIVAGGGSAGSASVGSGSAIVAVAADAAVAATPDAVAIAAVTPDAGVAATPDAAVTVAETTVDAGITGANTEKPADAKPVAQSDSLQVTSKPAGARVFIDGADQGVTPLKVPGSTDRHTIAVLMPGHDLYLAEVDGQGVYDVQMKPITPNGGHAGIKVIKCKDKERYYVYVDGVPTGMTCPTERIDTVVGPHVVEVYDIVTETRRKFDIVIKDERLSYRVKIED